MKIAQLNRLLTKHQQIGDEIEAAAKAIWPEGTEVEWDHHGHKQRGVVVGDDYTRSDDVRLLCMNHKTGRQVFVRYSTFSNSLYGC